MGKTDNPLLQKWDRSTTYSTAKQPASKKKETGNKKETSGKKQSYSNPLLQKWDRDDPYAQYSALSSGSSKSVKTPELDRAVGNDKDDITLLGRVGGAAGAGLMDSGAGFLEAGGKVSEVFGLAGGRDAVNKTALDKLFYDNADKLREKSEGIRERAYEGVNTLGGQIALDAVGGLAQLGGDLAVGAATGGAGALAALLTRSFGGAAYEAEQEGATLGQSVLYGVGAAGLEAGIEKLTGGLGKIYGKGVADDFVEGLVKHAAKNPQASWMLTRAINALGEGGEESLTTLLSPFVKTVYDEGEAVKSGYGTEAGRKELAKETAYSGALGAIIGAVGDITTSGLGSRTEQTSPLIIEQEQKQEVPTQEQTSPLIIEEEQKQEPTQPLNRSQANKILDDPAKKADFEKEYGVKLTGSKSEQAKTVMELAQKKAEAVAAEQQSNPVADALLGEEQQATQQPTGKSVGDMVTSEWVAQDAINPRNAYEFYSRDENGEPSIGYFAMKTDDGWKVYASDADGNIIDTLVVQELSQAGAAFDYILGANPQGTQPGQPTGPFHPINEQAQQETQAERGRGPVEIPVEDINGQLTPKTSSTLANAKITPNDFAAALQNDVTAGKFSRIPFSDAEAVAGAEKTITDLGWNEAMKQYESAVKSGQSSKAITALGVTLYNHAVNSGKPEGTVAAMNVASLLIENAKTTAQALQAVSIINKLSPEGRLYMVVRSVENIQQGLVAKFGGKAPNLEVNPELLNEYRDALVKGDEAAAKEAMTNITKDIASQVPATWQEQLQAWRYLAMLGNFRTQVRNIFGNAGFVPFRVVKNALATVGEQFLPEGVERTKAVLNSNSAADRALLQVAGMDFANVEDAIQSGGKYQEGLQSEVDKERTIFNNRLLEGYRKFVGDVMNKGDTWFSKPVYTSALAMYLKANGITAKQFADMVSGTAETTTQPTKKSFSVGDTVRARDRDNYGKIVGVNDDGSYSVYFKNEQGHEATVKLDGSILSATGKKASRDAFDVKTATPDQILARAREVAIQEAARATYRDANWLSEGLNKITSGVRRAAQGDGMGSGVAKAANIFMEGVLPFKKTPANVLARAIDYSPAGIIKGVVQLHNDVKAGKSAAEAIDSLAAGLTGTGVMLLGAFLRSQGVLSGSEDEDDKQAGFDSLQGQQNYALTVGDKNYTIDWLAPGAVSLFVGAEIMDAMQDRGLTLRETIDSMLDIADPIVEMSMLSGVQDMLETGKYGDAGIMAYVATAATSYLSQYIPTLFGQIERSTETGREETYRYNDEHSGVLGPTGQRFVGTLMNKLPTEYNQVDYIDAWGRTQDYEKGNFFNQMFNPSYISSDRSTAADSELQRLYDLGYTSVFPQRFAQSDEIATRDAEGNSIGKRHLTAEEYEQFNRTMGATRLELAESLIGSAQYKNMSNDERAKAIENIYAVGKAKAMLEVDPSYEPDSWVREALEAKDPAKYIGLYSAAQKLQPWGDNESVSSWQKVQYVAKAAGKDADDYVPLFFDTDSNYPKKYELARERGYSAERFAEFYEAYATIESDRDANGKSLGNVRQKVIADLVRKGWPEQYANEMYNLFKADRTKLNDWSW